MVCVVKYSIGYEIIVVAGAEVETISIIINSVVGEVVATAAADVNAVS